MTRTSSVIPYDADKLVRGRSRSILSREALEHPGQLTVTVGMATFISAIASGILTACWSGAAYVSGYVLDTLPAFLAIFAVAIAATTSLLHAMLVEEEEHEVLLAARRRLSDFCSTDRDSMHPQVRLPAQEITKLFNDDRILRSKEGRPLLLRLDAIVLNHEAIDREIVSSTDASRLRAEAGASIRRLLDAGSGTEDDAQDRIERLRAACAAVERTAIGGQAAPTAPTARIARIVDTAERMLAIDGDLVDGRGSRIDDLVRMHLPRLLQRHADAARTAATSDIADVDAELERAVEGIRASVEEAASSIHGQAMDALATEIRFLAARRGEPHLGAIDTSQPRKQH